MWNENLKKSSSSDWLNLKMDFEWCNKLKGGGDRAIHFLFQIPNFIKYVENKIKGISLGGSCHPCIHTASNPFPIILLSKDVYCVST